MHDNPIIDEVRAARREILESYGGDYRAMLRDMMRKQKGQEHLVAGGSRQRRPVVRRQGNR